MFVCEVVLQHGYLQFLSQGVYGRTFFEKKELIYLSFLSESFTIIIKINPTLHAVGPGEEVGVFAEICAHVGRLPETIMDLTGDFKS